MNYKKFYQQVLKTILSGKSDPVLRQYPNYYANNKDLISFNNHSLFLIPKEYIFSTACDRDYLF